MEDIQQRRTFFDKLGLAYEPEASVSFKHATMAGVPCYWLNPSAAAEGKILVWLHGGAYAVGSIRSHGHLISHFAAALGTRILFIDYSLAPEHPYPIALNEVLTVYTSLLETWPKVAFDFIGDSAGGGLILSLVDAIQDEPKIPFPHAAVLLSPWVSLDAGCPSMEENRGKDVFEKEYIQSSGIDYIGGTLTEKSNPANLRFNRFPPVLIMAGGDEVLRDDSLFFYEMIRAVQPISVLRIYPGQKHVWPLADIHSQASKQALAETVEFLNG